MTKKKIIKAILVILSVLLTAEDQWDNHDDYDSNPGKDRYGENTAEGFPFREALYLFGKRTNSS